MVCRYRKWDLGGNIKVVARCKLDAYMHTTMGEALVNIKACNEWDSKVCPTHACMHLHTHMFTPQSVAALLPLYCNGWSVCRECKRGWVRVSCNTHAPTSV